MFLEKLWLRIKGELIVFREDFGAGQDLREKAERLLHKLENQVASLTGGEKQGADARERPAAEPSGKEAQATDSLREIEREWEELKTLREEQKQKGKSDKTTPPNPRTLG